MRFHDDGLGSRCPSQSHDYTEDLFYLTASCVFLFIVLGFTCSGCRGLCRMEKMPYALKFIFVTASASSVAFTVLNVVTIVLCLLSHKKEALITAAISTFVYAVLFLCVWANLTVRLFMAFRERVLKISRKQQICYVITFVYLLLNALAASACQLLILVGNGFTPSIWFQLLLGVVFMIVFAVSALCIVFSFVSKLFTLEKVCEEEPIGLNKMQQKLMDLSSKYISLFLMASISSFITMFTGFYESATDLSISISLFLVPIDCCVNLICIYLQCEFADHQYATCCGKPDRCCKAVMTKIWAGSFHSDQEDAANLELKDIEEVKIENMQKILNLSAAMGTIPENRSVEMSGSEESLGGVTGICGAEEHLE